MTCIGIDPSYAKPVAYAYRWGRCWVVGSVEPEELWWRLEEVMERAKERAVTRCVIEDGFIGANSQVGMRLAQMRGGLEFKAQGLGLATRLVAPATWQRVLEVNGHRPRVHREIVTVARWRAQLETGKTLGEDESVAVCLAVWGEAEGGDG